VLAQSPCWSGRQEIASREYSKPILAGRDKVKEELKEEK